MRQVRFRIDKRLARDGRYGLDTSLALADLRDWSGDDLIMDVEANDGRSIIRCRRHFGPAQVYAFEPVEGTYRTLIERTKGFSGVKHFRFALGAKAERRTIYLHEGGSPMNSFYRERTGGNKGEEVEIDTLDAMIEREGIDSVQLLKIDTEGHDLEVLKGASQALSDGLFEIIQVETGFDVPGTPDASLWDFNELLRPYGYFLSAITNQCKGPVPQAARAGGRHGTMLRYCDALFTKG